VSLNVKALKGRLEEIAHLTFMQQNDVQLRPYKYSFLKAKF